MQLCCCKRPKKRKALKNISTQTDILPLLEVERLKQQNLFDIEAKRRSSLATALRLAQQAIEEDRASHYEEALSLYQHTLVYFLESLNYETGNENIKDKILTKCKRYLERAEVLAEHINSHGQLRRLRPASLSDVTKSVMEWIEREDFEQKPSVESPRNTASRKFHKRIKKPSFIT